MDENITPVSLKVDGFETREVIKVHYQFDQSTDVEGQISGIPRGGKINVKVKALNDGNTELLGWMLDTTNPKGIKIEFKNTIDGKTMKSIDGKGCYCIHYNNHWSEGKVHCEEIVINCQTLQVGAAQFSNPWK